ncbi:MAG: hypothetical protein IPK96_02305 [Flammeovirgaceae bacterium]|nr:hypothetical protein [Flammeovirgaceae bacterium]
MRKFFVLLLLATSCSPIYVPTTRNVPLFREQGEFQGSVYITTGFEAQLAYALTDHVAAIGNANFFKYHVDNQNYDRKNSFAEAGLGFYNVTRKYRTELFVGYGQGQGTNFESYYFFTQSFGQKALVATGKMNRIFVQPSIGTNNRKFNLAITARFSFVDYTEFSSSDNDPNYAVVTVRPDEKPHLFLEPSLTGKVPLAGNLQGIFQLGLNTPLPNDAYFDYVPVQFSVGIQLNTGSLRTRVY